MNTIKIVSAGKEEDVLKDQDRANFYIKGGICTGIVCDGTSTSPNAEKAAQYVVDSAFRIFEEENGLGEIVQALLEMRGALLERGVKLSPAQEPLRKYFEDILREKLRASYQTTLVAAQWQQSKDKLKLKWVGCGDSAIFVFDPDGKILWSNLVETATSLFGHTSPITQVVPDSYNAEKHVVSEEKFFPWDCGILLCSDGFYDIFETFNEIYDWMLINRDALADKTKQDDLMLPLHKLLVHKKGDDDISLVLRWLKLSSSLDYLCSDR